MENVESTNLNLIKKLNKPRKKRINIEMLKKEQKFTKFNRKRFDELIKELDIQEPIEQLLQMI